MLYEKYDLVRDAKLAHNYLTRMVDPARDYLPYWLIMANENPAWARHCRVDDAELVASWYEALDSVMKILGTNDGAEVLNGFKTHLLRSWGEHGLRYHEKYPWTMTLHSSFHEMAYIVSALNRLIRNEPDNDEAKTRLRELIRGMRSLVIERKMRTFWSGDYPFEEKIYEFPNDVYLQDKGWDLSCVTGRGEESIRNGMILQPVVETYELTGDEAALDLAVGYANYLIGISRYFNYKGEFFGHVHSAVWAAGGLVQLGRLTGEKKYIDRGHNIYKYVLSISSSFGWVPEYAQWAPPERENCETCCIKDMIYCSFELIRAGFDEYWDVVNRFARNHLSEQQFKSGSFVGVSNDKPDTEDTTWHHMDERLVGGYSGGGEPNNIALSKFRSIAGCCVGTAPQALGRVWDNIMTVQDGKVTVNLPIEKDAAEARVEIGYPNEGYLQVTARQAGPYALRVLPFMKDNLRLTVDGQTRPVWVQDGCAQLADVNPGQVLRLEHNLAETVRPERVRAIDLQVTWKGPDVVAMAPEGDELALYQRTQGEPKRIPGPPPLTPPGTKHWFEAKPTDQKTK